ncbi:MAG: thrombospondin type 3 repeat-containing protein [Methylococcaceae bacterium]|nr:thrombospondin type 3 repeat-containing protein [Methylococcaceae bacterium]
MNVTTINPSYNPSDSDGDGIPDSWEIQYGLNPFSNTDASRDSDGDGQTNLAEYQAGRNPLVNEAAVLSPLLSAPNPRGYISELKRPGSLLMKILPVIVQPD